MITAGKFLEHFISYPWMHLDVAGVSFYTKEMNYRGVHGTGTGVRLVYNFIKSLSTK
jgi:leucyl aminopeptidase